MTDMHFGIARTMQILLEMINPEHVVHVVRNHEDADELIKTIS